ncbi:MAG: glycosyltransferase [Anaerolineaceae bacterium]|nr:glycosyltransferase [Anaerolineaceae bacterium]
MKSKPERIALFYSSLRGGGVERSGLNLASGLRGRGYEVDLVLVNASGELLDQVPPGVRLVNLAAGRALLALLPLIRYMRSAKPFAMLSAQTHNNIIAVWARQLSLLRTRLVVSEHTYLSAVASNPGNTRARMHPLAIRIFYPKADQIVAVSKGVAADLSLRTGISRERIQVIYNPIVTPQLFSLASESLAHPWFSPGQPQVILAVGRLALPKDYFTLLRAFAIIRQQRLARLLILGEGRLRQSLEREVRQLGLKEDISLPGFVANPYAYMARAGVFALSSAWEGLSNVLVEAMACGAPVVSTDCPSGPSEILENGRYGRLTPVGDAPALAEAITATLDDPLPADVLRSRSLDFSVAHAVDSYIRVMLA